jgi:hypothetical protein
LIFKKLIALTLSASLFLTNIVAAVPTIRIADEEAMSRKIHEVAQMVGTERFYLTVGGLLHKKGATVGLKPDGVVVRNDAERINAGKILEEKVQESESHKRTVINPAVAEFVAMMGQIDELQQVRARVAAQQATDRAFKSAGKSKPQEIHTSVRDLVIDKLLETGATPDEIERIVLNPRMNEVLSDAQDVRNVYGKGPIAVVVGNPSKEEYDAQVRAQEQRYNGGYLEASLNLFADGAVALDEFATENPRLAQLSLLALEAAMSGPSRFVTNFCSKELGIRDKLDVCKDKIHGWLSGKVSDITKISPETSGLLISGGVFGAGFAFSMAGIQQKDTILKDAKKVGEVNRKLVTREKRWMQLAEGKSSRLPKEVRETIRRTAGRNIYKEHGLELAHRPGKPAAQGHDYSDSLPKTKVIHRNQHRFYTDTIEGGFSLKIPPRKDNSLIHPRPGIFKRLNQIEQQVKK